MNNFNSGSWNPPANNGCYTNGTWYPPAQHPPQFAGYAGYSPHPVNPYNPYTPPTYYQPYFPPTPEQAYPPDTNSQGSLRGRVSGGYPQSQQRGGAQHSNQPPRLDKLDLRSIKPFVPKALKVESPQKLTLAQSFAQLPELSDTRLAELLNIQDGKNYLSDHVIIRSKIGAYPEGIGEVGNIFSWNLLGKMCEFSGKKEFNNPWKIKETRDTYSLRLEKQINKISQILQSDNRAVAFLLQEAWYILQNYNFTDRITGLGWAVVKDNSKASRSSAILYKKEYLRLVRTKLETTQKRSGSRSEIKAELVGCFKDLRNGQNLEISSIHLNPTSNGLKKILGRKTPVLRIVGGDFNQRLKGSVEDPEALTAFSKRMDRVGEPFDHFVPFVPEGGKIFMESKGLFLSRSKEGLQFKQRFSGNVSQKDFKNRAHKQTPLNDEVTSQFFCRLGREFELKLFGKYTGNIFIHPHPNGVGFRVNYRVDDIESHDSFSKMMIQFGAREQVGNPNCRLRRNDFFDVSRKDFLRLLKRHGVHPQFYSLLTDETDYQSSSSEKLFQKYEKPQKKERKSVLL